MHADNICCFCPSAKDLRSLLDICCEYADDHGIVFNGKKANCLVFKPRKWRSPEPVLFLNNTEIKIVNEVKYLGFVLDAYFRDDCDIKRQTRAVYCIANKLRSNFYSALNMQKMCSIDHIASLCTDVNYGVIFIPIITTGLE